MPVEFSEIVELEECGWRNANFYLGNGYQLLSVQNQARPASMPSDDGKHTTPYTRRGPIYVVGRPVAVERVSRPERTVEQPH